MHNLSHKCNFHFFLSLSLFVNLTDFTDKNYLRIIHSYISRQKCLCSLYYKLQCLSWLQQALFQFGQKYLFIAWLVPKKRKIKAKYMGIGNSLRTIRNIVDSFVCFSLISFLSKISSSFDLSKYNVRVLECVMCL